MLATPSTLLARLRSLTLDDLAERTVIVRVPAWRRRLIAQTGSAELKHYDLLLRAYVAYWAEGPAAACCWLDQIAPPSIDGHDLGDWYYWSFVGVTDAGRGELEAALGHHARAAQIADARGSATLAARSQTNMAYLLDTLGRHDEAFACLAEVVRSDAPAREVAVAAEVLAGALDRFRLFDIARPHWETAMATMPAKEVNLHCRMRVGFVRSRLHSESVEAEQLGEHIAVLETLLDHPSVSVLVRARAAVAVGWWKARHEDWDGAQRLLDEHASSLVDGSFPVNAIEAAHLTALLAMHAGHFDEVEAVLARTDLGVAANNEVEALLRLVIAAQSENRQWQRQDLTYRMLNNLLMASRRNREHLAFQENKRQIARLEAEQAALAEAVASRDGLMKIVSHELRGPLSTMSLDLERVVVENPDGSREPPIVLLEAYAHMVAMVDHLSLVGQVDGDSIAVDLAPVDIGELVAAVCERVSPSALAKGQILVCHSPDDDVRCRTDGRWLAIIVDNFVGNAIKFCDRGDTIRTEVVRDERGVTIGVSDTGPGFGRVESTRLFQRYARLRSSPSGGETSSGLGLYLAGRLAETIGARVGASSPGFGQGACFWVAVPYE